MLERFAVEQTFWITALAKLGYSILHEDNYSIEFSNNSNWNIRLCADPRESFCDVVIVNTKHNKSFYLTILMDVFLWTDPAENILYCSINRKSKGIIEILQDELDFLLHYKDDILNDSFDYEEKYNHLDGVLWWVLPNGTPPDLSFLGILGTPTK